MRKKLSISLATAFLMISGGAYADGNITGTVFNKTTSKPLDFATVVLVNPETGAPLPIGTTTDENGVFIIPNAPSGKYIVRVSMIGNVTQEREITIGNSEINLGKIELGHQVASGSGHHRAEKPIIGQCRAQNFQCKLKHSRHRCICR